MPDSILLLQFELGQRVVCTMYLYNLYLNFTTTPTSSTGSARREMDLDTACQWVRIDAYIN